MNNGPTCNGCGVPYPDDIADGDLCDACGQPYTEDTDDIDESNGSDDVENDDE